MSGEEGKRWGGGTTRRTILKTAVGAGAVAGAGVGGVLLTTRDEPVLAASGLTAEDVDIENNDGSVSALTINPEPTVKWENLEESADVVVVDYWVRLSGSDGGSDGGSDYVARQEDSSIDGTSGTVTVSQFSTPRNLLEETSLTSGDFEDTTEDGEPETTDVELAVGTALGKDNGDVIIDTQDTVTFTVSVSNLESSVSVSGPMNTGGE